MSSKEAFSNLLHLFNMKKKYQFLFTFLCIVGYFPCVAQEVETVLPKGLSNQEAGLISNFQFKNNTESTVPDLPIRTAAEWEEIEYLVIRWTPAFQNILLQIVQAAVTECKVLITTQNQTAVASFLSSQNVNMAQVEFLNAPSNSIWIRDYAGNTGYTNDVEDRVLVDWIYNRPRPADNVMPAAHANYTQTPIYSTDFGDNDLVNTGGNFMSDGLGTAFASKLIVEENEAGNPYGVSAKTEAEIDAIMLQFQGISNFIKFDPTPFDPIDHIDMHMKLLDEETILVSNYPDGVADGPQINANIEYLTTNFLSPFGTPYKIEWIDAPPSTTGLYPDEGGFYRTYTNSVFVNGTVIVPTYRPEVDMAALQKYEELLPGYNIVGVDVDNSDELLIALSGAIHCITHAIGVADPLLIIHSPKDEVSSPLNIPFSAVIKHASGISQAKLFWRESGENEYEEAQMTLQNEATWEATITAPSGASSIEYYIWAEANSGKTLSRPIVAPEGFWKFNITSLSLEDWASKNIHGPFPNPAKEQVSFTINAIPGELTIRIFNIVGQQLFENTLQEANGRVLFNLQPEWKGTLLVQFSGEFGSITKKLIKL